MVDTVTEAVKSLLEAPIEKPVLLSEAALENLYNISHNVQEYFNVLASIHNKSNFQDFLRFCGFKWEKKDKKKKSLAKRKKKVDKNKKVKKKRQSF